MLKKSIEKPLRDYQRTAIEWALDRLYVQNCPGAALFLDPGLGKTRTSLSIAELLFGLREIKRCLIVAPLRTVYNTWPQQITEWGFDLTNIILHDQVTQAMKMDCQLELINPEGLVKLVDCRKRWDLIIVDESTKFKIWSTQRMKYLRKMLHDIPKRLILTGTPAINSLADLHAQMFIVDNGQSLGKTVTYFRDTYMQLKDCGKWRKWEVRPSMRQHLLDAIADKALRMDAESYLDMPRLIEHDIWCDMPPDIAREYKRMKRELLACLETGDITAGTASAVYQKCCQMANGSVYSTDEFTRERTSHIAHDRKISALMDLREELQGKQLLTFYQYTHDMQACIERYKKKLSKDEFKRVAVIRGRMKRGEADAIIKAWNEGEIIDLFCQSLTAAHGLNLQYGGCHDVAFLGIPDMPEVYKQDYCRIFRQGVESDYVRLHRLLTRGTVDEQKLDRINGKLGTEIEFLTALKDHALAA